MEYKNLAELEGKCLEYEDIVILKDIKYSVETNHLRTADLSEYNNKIFKDLSLDKYDFCTEHYGYDAKSGDWPECKHKDYKALTRVVKALFEIIEKEGSKESEFKVGDQVYIIPYDECIEKGIETRHLRPEYFGIFGTIKRLESIGVMVKTIKGDWWYSIEALIKPAKDYEIKITAPTLAPISLDYCSIAEACNIASEPKSNKIKVSSEFKFTVNKPKKVFF